MAALGALFVPFFISLMLFATLLIVADWLTGLGQ